MTGKATIILNDAATGAEISRVEEHNMFTNAVSNILNPPHYAILNSFDYSRLFYYALPMWKYMLSGVMLLGNREEENADNILLSANSVPIATAGTAYSGTCITRGTLNQNETYQTDNGYHFTWDFATDKANGTINCICLTSQRFGDTGFCTENSNGFFISPQRWDTTGYQSTMDFILGYGVYIGTYEDGLHYFVYYTSDSTLEIRKYKSQIDPEAIRINSTHGTSSMPQPVSVTTLPIDLSLYYYYKFFLNPQEKTLCFFENTYLERDDTSMTFRYAIVDFGSNTSQTYTVKLQTPLAYNAYYGCGAVYNGKIYFSTLNNQVLIFSLDGKLLETRSNVSTSNGDIYFLMNGQLMKYNPNYYFVYAFDWGVTMPAALPSYYPLGSLDSIPAPYFAASKRAVHNLGYASSGDLTALTLCSAYKATINNLSTPIKKTSDNTLKIVYDITN